MKLFLPLLAASSAACAWLYRARQQRLQYEAFVRGLAQPQQYRGLPVVVVVDVGSSSIRASCFALVAEAQWTLIQGSLQQQHVSSIYAHGEADAAVIAATVEQILDRTMRFLRATDLAQKLVGVGFSTFAMNVLGVDAKGNIATPVYTVRWLYREERGGLKLMTLLVFATPVRWPEEGDGAVGEGAAGEAGGPWRAGGGPQPHRYDE